jgi:hypothetical protein
VLVFSEAIMTNPQPSDLISFALPGKGSSSYNINAFLQQGTYRLIVVAPFNTRILVSPSNPAPGLDFRPDQDATAEIWNSLLVTPQAGQYNFLVRADWPIDNDSLQIQFIFQAPPAEPPATPPPAPPQPPPTIPGDMQDYYRKQGYRIASDGAVEFYYVAFRTNKVTGMRELCLNGLFSWSGDLHDPTRTLSKLGSEDGTYRYTRPGSFANRARAEASAVQFAVSIFNDPTRYGIWGTGGLGDIQGSDYRNPSFR